MRTSRSLFVASVTAALAIATMGGPTAAATPRVAFVNGIPGLPVDVCVGQEELVSRLRYGEWADRGVPAGTRAFRFRAAGPGSCAGSLLARRSLVLSADDDLTVVATRRSPRRVSVFVGTGLGLLEPTAEGSLVLVRHAADLGDAAFKASTSHSPITPLADPVWQKADQFVSGLAGTGVLSVVVTRPDASQPLASVALRYGGPHGLDRIELYLVGTRARNARLVAVRRLLVD